MFKWFIWQCVNFSIPPLLFGASCILSSSSLHSSLMLSGSSFLHVQSSHVSIYGFPYYPLAPSFSFPGGIFSYPQVFRIVYQEDHCDFVLFIIYSSSFNSMSILPSAFFKINLFIYLFMAACGVYSSLRCVGFSLRWLLVAEHRL